jgi:multiple sugar transport system permease protein
VETQRADRIPHRSRLRLLPALGSLRPRLAATRRLARGRRLLPIYGLLLPGMALYGIWAAYPLINSFVLSFTDWSLTRPVSFVGLDNYLRAVNDPLFWRSLASTLGYTVVTVAGQMVLGLGAALLLNERIPARAVFRLVYYLPVISSWVIVSLVFLYLYNGQSGALNWLLKDVLGVIDRNVAWLAEPSTALWAIAVLGIWKGIGWTMIVFLAGLQSVPEELYEAASIDGAGTRARFRHVTLPFLRQTSTFLLVVLTIGGFNAFISIFVMSSAATGTIGGPLNSTDVVLTYMWKQAFAEIDLGYGAALSFLLATAIVAVSLVEFRLLKRQGVA